MTAAAAVTAVVTTIRSNNLIIFSLFLDVLDNLFDGLRCQHLSVLTVSLHGDFDVLLTLD